MQYLIKTLAKRLMGDVQSSAIQPILSLMRTYSFAYTANHDFGVCASIMVDDYELRMGPHWIVGRDGGYRKATQRQYDQFPGLGFIVHDVVTNGERVALRFSEHGHSEYADADAVWAGISMYQWDGSRLVSCWVEQDYFARRRQLRTGVANQIEAPGMDPWSTGVEPANPASEAIVRAWILGGGIDDSVAGSLDDEWCSPVERASLLVRDTTIDDIFSAGNRVAFHVSEVGETNVGAGTNMEVTSVTRYLSGIAQVDGSSISARVVTDRLSIAKQLSSKTPRLAGGGQLPGSFAIESVGGAQRETLTSASRTK